jgi:membrane protein DedA with SNARE-associated domain
VEGFLDWLTSVPTAVLYATLAAISAVENIFPPIPADTVVAFGSFLAARGHGTAIGAFLATLAGNLGGAMVMFAVGRRYGAATVEQRLGSARSAGRLHALYGKFGMLALFVSRFIPGVRALVPPFAGALRLPPIRTAIVIGTASAIWYGLITYLAFRVGSDWDTLLVHLRGWSRWMVTGAATVGVVGALTWLFLRRRTESA